MFNNYIAQSKKESINNKSENIHFLVNCNEVGKFLQCAKDIDYPRQQLQKRQCGKLAKLLNGKNVLNFFFPNCDKHDIDKHYFCFYYIPKY